MRELLGSFINTLLSAEADAVPTQGPEQAGPRIVLDKVAAA